MPLEPKYGTPGLASARPGLRACAGNPGRAAATRRLLGAARGAADGSGMPVAGPSNAADAVAAADMGRGPPATPLRKPPSMSGGGPRDPGPAPPREPPMCAPARPLGAGGAPGRAAGTVAVVGAPHWNLPAADAEMRCDVAAWSSKLPRLDEREPPAMTGGAAPIRTVARLRAAPRREDIAAAYAVASAQHAARATGARSLGNLAVDRGATVERRCRSCEPHCGSCAHARATAPPTAVCAALAGAHNDRWRAPPERCTRLRHSHALIAWHLAATSGGAHEWLERQAAPSTRNGRRDESGRRRVRNLRATRRSSRPTTPRCPPGPPGAVGAKLFDHQLRFSHGSQRGERAVGAGVCAKHTRDTTGGVEPRGECHAATRK